MEILNLKKEIIKKLSELEDGALLNLSNISCSKQILSTLIFRYRGGKKEFHPDFEKYIEKIDFNGIDFSHFNCIGINFERLTGVKIDPQSIYKRSLEHAKCKGVTFIGSFDNVRITNTDFTGSKNARIDPCKVQDRNLENSIYKENHIHGLRVRVCESRWWRRGESNSCPKTYPQEALRAQFVVNIPLPQSPQTSSVAW